MFANFISAVKLITYPWMACFTMIFVLDDKGGVGKSLIAQICAALLRSTGEYNVEMMDTDDSNSSTMESDHSASMVDLKTVKAKGTFITALQRVYDGSVSHIVVDVGAREEKLVRALLPWLATLVRELGGQIVIVRPIALSAHNQRNAGEFMTFVVEHKLPVIFVRNEGQGRCPADFDRWLTSEIRRKAIELGAVETVVTDAGVLYADEANGFGISLAECAVEDFSRIEDEEDRKTAPKLFTKDVCAFLNEWLRTGIRDFGDAIQEAIAIRAVLDGTGLAFTEPSVPKRKPKAS